MNGEVFIVIKNENYFIFDYIKTIKDNVNIIYIKNYISDSFINNTKNKFKYYVIDLIDLSNFIYKNNIKKIYIQNDSLIKKIILNIKKKIIIYVGLILDDENINPAEFNLYNYYICFNQQLYNNIKLPIKNKEFFNIQKEMKENVINVEILTNKQEVKEKNKQKLSNDNIEKEKSECNKSTESINNISFIVLDSDSCFDNYKCDIYIKSNLKNGYILYNDLDSISLIDKLIISKKAYYDLGGFDKSINNNFEQIYDFLYRAAYIGYKIYNDNQKIDNNRIKKYSELKVKNGFYYGDENQKKVSLILSLYNGIEFLDGCLKNILRQTYENLEVIIINDGTKENIDDIILKYQNQNKIPIKYYKNNGNKGLAYSLNKGIKKSTGYYVAKIDVDDFMHKDKIKLQVEYLEKNKDIDMSVTSFFDFTREEQINEDELYKSYNNKKIYNPKIIKENYTVDKINHCVCIGTMLVKRNCLIEIGGYDNSIKYGEDLDLAARFVNFGYNISGIMNNLYFRRVVGDRMSNINNISEVHNNLVKYVKEKLKNNKLIGNLEEVDDD